MNFNLLTVSCFASGLRVERSYLFPHVPLFSRYAKLLQIASILSRLISCHTGDQYNATEFYWPLVNAQRIRHVARTTHSHTNNSRETKKLPYLPQKKKFRAKGRAMDNNNNELLERVWKRRALYSLK